MRHPRVALLLLLAAPVVAAGRDTPAQALARRQAACEPVKAQVLAAIRAEGSACSESWQCRALPSWLLGCDAWANRAFRLPEALGEALDEACGPFSLEPSCAPRVGACVAGRCAGRPEATPGCAEARQALRKREAERTACRVDDDCARRSFPAEAAAVAAACRIADLEEAHRELARCREASREDGVLGRSWQCEAEAGSPPYLMKATCESERCLLREAGPRPDAWGAEGSFERPRLRDPACVMKGLRLQPADLQSPGFAIQFQVDPRGKARGFTVAERQGAGSIPLAAAVDAIQSCEWLPGRDPKGRPVVMWVVQPFRFR